MPIKKQTFRETLIDMIDRLPGVEAFEQNNLIRIRCYGCGNRIQFDNGVAVSALEMVSRNRPDLNKFMEYVQKCISEHVCSKQIIPTIEVKPGANFRLLPLQNPSCHVCGNLMIKIGGDFRCTSCGASTGVVPAVNAPIKAEPAKPKFTRRFDLE